MVLGRITVGDYGRDYAPIKVTLLNHHNSRNSLIPLDVAHQFDRPLRRQAGSWDAIDFDAFHSKTFRVCHRRVS
jgi:hypothetical protein